MSDQGNGNGVGDTGAAAQGGEQPPQIRMSVLTQYVRDLSFENVLAQKGTGGEVTPDIQVGVSLDARKRTAADQYEVITKLQINSRDKNSGQQLFLLELEYAGVFRIEGIPDEQLHPFLLIECPRQLFPFIRRVVSDITRDGGFPPLNLENIDWLQLYRARLQQAQGQAGEAAQGSADA
ncbi:MAG: protein-export chaperone SecB [Roseovarius sp.]